MFEGMTQKEIEDWVTEHGEEIAILADAVFVPATDTEPAKFIRKGLTQPEPMG